MPLDLPLVHLYATSVVEPGGMSKASLSVRDRLSLAKEGKLQWKEAKVLVTALFSLTDGC